MVYIKLYIYDLNRLKPIGKTPKDIKFKMKKFTTSNQLNKTLWNHKCIDKRDYYQKPKRSSDTSISSPMTMKIIYNKI